MKKITVNDLSAEEKLRLICGKDCWRTEGLGGKLPEVFVSDGPMGLRTVKTDADGKEETILAIAYPSINALANTWSTEAAKEMGECLADDCIDRGVDLLLAPGVNVKRHPLNGRNFEYFSEDPYLAGTLAREYIAGVQEGGIGTCLKHFCCNNLEYDRFHQTSDVDERTLREIYYVPFEIACEAKPVSVMCSYNRVNGTYASEYKKGFDVLRKEFGFDGAIFSDWNAVRDRTAAAKAGLDIEMPFSQENYEKLCEDYRAGKLTDEQLDACAKRVIDFVFRCKEMGKNARARRSEKERAEAAKHIASEGIVLLKNENVLPMSEGRSVMVCGCYAKPDTTEMLSGGGSARVEWSDKTFDLPEQLKKRGFAVSYEPAFRYEGVCSWNDARRAQALASESDICIVCVGTGAPVEYEGADRQTLRLPAAQESAILETAQQCKNTVVVVFAGGAIEMSAWADKVSAIVFAGLPGMGGDEVIADILTGKICPSGKLSETIPVTLSDVAAVNSFRCAGVTRYSEGLDVGYRYFEKYNVPVQFPFGHGLSYAAFDYSGLRLESHGTCLILSYDIKNVSQRTGKEVSQVYVRECTPLVYRPLKELRAFAKTQIAADEVVTVRHTLGPRAFSHWSSSQDAWEITDGVYEIMVGASVSDIRLRAKVRIKDGQITVIG